MAIWIAWLNAIVPLLAVVGAYIIALVQGYDASCIPFVEGCTSISRAARYDDAIFWFRGLMLPLVSLLVLYWIYHRRWLVQLVGAHYRHTVILWLGILSALALSIYVNFLGSEGDVYRFMRRFGVTFYFGLAMLAQLLSIYSLYHVRESLTRSVNRLVTGQLFLVGAQWLIGLGSLAITIMQPDYKDQANNIMEWNFALMMTIYYAISAILWKLPTSKITPTGNGL
jgi:hypothetical protein